MFHKYEKYNDAQEKYVSLMAMIDGLDVFSAYQGSFYPCLAASQSSDRFKKSP